ncbi:hypothetical protein ACFQ08_09115 [Streptosporangium algeriense]|uniref:DUF4178 domain-containing protein n=1 Tax=Streptosporangium algeriense TaxID=1682748 RepID=A0ABW3DPY7_9ACTN
MPEQYNYQLGERVRVIVEGLITHMEPAANACPEELTVELEHSAGGYGVTVPLDTVTIERLVPADGVPQPGELWRDRHGRTWFAHENSLNADIALRCTDGDCHLWRSANMNYGPLTRTYPPAVAEQPIAFPELRVGDLWEDHAGDVWRVVERAGRVLLFFGGEYLPWEDVSAKYKPLKRVGPKTAEPEPPAVAEQPTDVPELRVGDRWRDRESCVWRVVETYGQLMLACDYTGEQQRWEGVSAKYGPLTRIIDTAPGGAA